MFYFATKLRRSFRPCADTLPILAGFRTLSVINKLNRITDFVLRVRSIYRRLDGREAVRTVVLLQAARRCGRSGSRGGGAGSEMLLSLLVLGAALTAANTGKHIGNCLM
ncbi:hypothetical protein EVAR_63214_1 [Eumeta japonica]|uniref:Uncharacterized protein n=1 Tax=Eumeta variegata TaxID=151549 RepID=A0A4C1ZIK8_EUMVA|nr:hypothetical protein EVAR_63214_1 [Eumeta japonica]